MIFLIRWKKKYMIHKLIISICIILFSCNKKTITNNDDFQDIDVLTDANISISKGDQKVVNAVSEKLFKDDTHIYLKANYNTSESSKLRNKLASAVIQNPSYSMMIRKLASDLHDYGGNVKAEFYSSDTTANIISSILYSDSARISNVYNNMIAEGNVVIYSPTTDLMLLGNKVLWDNRAKRILSEDNVTIVKITDNDKSPCIQKSVGFESDMDLSNYIFYNIKGKIGEDCF